MPKAIMISIQPKWVEKILNGKKDREFRKTMPKCEFPIDAYIYCTKGEELWGDGTGETWKGIDENEDMQLVHELSPTLARLNGKVVAKFTLKDIDDFYVFNDGLIQYWIACDLEKGCVPYDDLANYIGRGKKGYAWHIDNLEIFDNPKELSEFHYLCPDCTKCRDCPYFYYHNTETDTEFGCSNDLKRPITRAPQSWQFVEVE